MPLVLDGELSLQLNVDGEANLQLEDDAEVGIYMRVADYDNPPYTGPTQITPSTTAQVLATKGTNVLSNITINPIPNNYGLITWNGSVLTVS